MIFAAFGIGSAIGEPMKQENKMKHSEISDKKKREMYAAGDWYAQLKFVPVHKGDWSDEDWIKFIDHWGSWKVNGKWTETHKHGKPESWWWKLREE